MVGVLIYIALAVEKSDLNSREDNASQLAARVPGHAGSKSAAPRNEDVPVRDNSSPCVSMEAFVAGPEAYQLDSWFMSWGAPPIGNTADAAHSYSWYDEKTLLDMSRAGDAVAKHERGLRLVMSALTDVNTVPKDSSIWDIAVDSEELPLAQRINSDKLSEGRDLLYEAAVLGRTYALIEIALSYSFERQARSIAGDLDPDTLLELRVSAHAFGESVETLLPVLHSSFFQAPLPGELRMQAGRELDLLTERIVQERFERGVVLPRMNEEVEKQLHSLNICGN